MSDGQQQRKRPCADEVSMVKQPAKIPRGVTLQPKEIIREEILADVAEKQTTLSVSGSSTSAKKTQSSSSNRPTPSARPVMMQFGSFAGPANGGSPDTDVPQGDQTLLHGEMCPEGMSLVNHLLPKWRLFTSFAPSIGYSVLEKRQLILLEDVEKIYLPKKPIWEVIADHEAKYRNIRPEYVPPTNFPFGMSDSTRQMIAQLYPDISGFCFLADYLGYSVIEKRRHILLEDIYLAYTNSLPGQTIQEGVGSWLEKYNSVRHKFGMANLPPVVFQPTVVVPVPSSSPQSEQFATSSEDTRVDGQQPAIHQRPLAENGDQFVPVDPPPRVPQLSSGSVESNMPMVGETPWVGPDSSKQISGRVIICPSEVDSNRKQKGKESDDDVNKGGPSDSSAVRGREKKIIRRSLLQGEAKIAMEKKWFLTITAKNLNCKAIEDLVLMGADVNAKDNIGLTALHLSCCHKNENVIDVVRLLIEYGADTKTKSKCGRTALHWLCQCYKNENLIDIVRILIESGIDINAKVDDGRTALHWLCRNYSNENLIDVVRLLIQNGADTKTIKRRASVERLYSISCVNFTIMKI